MVESADVDLRMVSVLGVLVELVPVTTLPVSGRSYIPCHGLARTH